jgi:hypothetical protein
MAQLPSPENLPHSPRPWGSPTMRAGAVVLAVAIVLASLGARAADLVVWWEKGHYAQADEAVTAIIAAFEQKTGEQVEIVQPGRSVRLGALAAAGSAFSGASWSPRAPPGGSNRRSSRRCRRSERPGSCRSSSPRPTQTCCHACRAGPRDSADRSLGETAGRCTRTARCWPCSC